VSPFRGDDPILADCSGASQSPGTRRPSGTGKRPAWARKPANPSPRIRTDFRASGSPSKSSEEGVQVTAPGADGDLSEHLPEARLVGSHGSVCPPTQPAG
jgi:hypothetical protein